MEMIIKFAAVSHVCCCFYATQIPEIRNWYVTMEGEVRGNVYRHESLDDGDEIETSMLAYPKFAEDRALVETKSGSLYRLGIKAKTTTAPPTKKSPPPTNNKAPPAPKMPIINNPFASPKLRQPSLQVQKQEQAKPNVTQKKSPTLSQKQPLVSNPFASPKPRQPSLQVKKQEEPQVEVRKLLLPLTGETIGDGKYLLAGKAKSSTNGRCQVLSAYLADEHKQAAGEPLAIKISSNAAAMKREYANFQKLWAGSRNGHIVQCHEFLPVVDSAPRHKGKCALVLERGTADLKEHRQSTVMEDDHIKDALLSAVCCMERIHGARLVWTDLKSENFILTGDQKFKAIDLESAVTVKGNPLDYTPEACPPEFARAFANDEAYDFVLDYHYDVWSFGMLAYELTTGYGHFDGSRPDQIMKRVASLDIPKVKDTVGDDKLADLITQCLQEDPKHRPNAQRIHNHPYFRGSAAKSMFGFNF
jgi:hypothetical protein